MWKFIVFFEEFRKLHIQIEQKKCLNSISLLIVGRIFLSFVELLRKDFSIFSFCSLMILYKKIQNGCDLGSFVNIHIHKSHALPASAQHSPFCEWK